MKSIASQYTIAKIILTAALFLLSGEYSKAAGIVAETDGGKLIVFEWETRGSGKPPVFVQAELKIIAPDGKVLFEDAFNRESVIKYDEGDYENGRYEVRLNLKNADATFDLIFIGTNRSLDLSNQESEIDALLRQLKDPKRKFEDGSTLIIKTPIGKFSLHDVICSIYGDL